MSALTTAAKTEVSRRNAIRELLETEAIERIGTSGTKEALEVEIRDETRTEILGAITHVGVKIHDGTGMNEMVYQVGQPQ